MQETRDDSPDAVAAFTWPEVIRAVRVQYPSRFAIALGEVEAYQPIMNVDTLTIKMWETP